MMVSTEKLVNYDTDELLDLECEYTVGLFYVKEWNVFMDEGGFIVWNIFEIITPNDLFLFKKYKEYMIIPHCTEPGVLVELFWPDDEDGDYN